MATICRDSDTGSHGGTVSSSATKTYIEGAAVLLNGDTYNCSTHGAQTVTANATKTYAEGKLICLDGAVTSCGATITATTSNTYAE